MLYPFIVHAAWYGEFEDPGLRHQTRRNGRIFRTPLHSEHLSRPGLKANGNNYFKTQSLSLSLFFLQNSSLLLQSQTSIDLSVEGGANVAMDNSTLNITAQLLQVMSPTDSHPTLSIGDDVITVGASLMEVKGTLGMVLNGPLETGHISSPPNTNLNIESASGSLIITGRGGVQIQDGPAFDGVEVTSNERLTIASRSEVSLIRFSRAFTTISMHTCRLYWTLRE